MIFSEKTMTDQMNTVLKQLYDKSGVTIKNSTDSLNTLEVPLSYTDLVNMLETKDSPPVPPILAALAEVDDRFIFRKSKSRLEMPEMQMSLYFDLEDTPSIKPSITENDLILLGFCYHIKVSNVKKPYSIYRYPRDSYNVFVRIFDL